MKTDKQGCSTCEPGQEHFEEYQHNGRSFVQYDYRTLDGALFSCVRHTLELCREARDNWLLVREISPADAPALNFS